MARSAARTRNSLSFLALPLMFVVGLLTPTAGHAQASLVVNRLVHVAATGTGEENCLAVKAVILGITDAMDSNPYLVKLEPGLYDCGPITIFMKPFVSLEGSGMSTSIRGEGSFIVIELASNSELRSLKVENLSSGCIGPEYAVGAFLNSTIVNARLFEVVAESTACPQGVAYLGAGSASGQTDVAIDHSELRGTSGAIELNLASDAITCSFSILDGGIDRAALTTSCLVCTSASTLLDSNCDP